MFTDSLEFSKSYIRDSFINDHIKSYDDVKWKLFADHWARYLGETLVIQSAKPNDSFMLELQSDSFAVLTKNISVAFSCRKV